MILLNLIIWPNTTYTSRNFALGFNQKTNFSKPLSSNKKNLNVACVVKSPEILRESKKDIAKKRFIKQSFWQKIINNTLYQTVFLSIPVKASDKYVVELNYLNLYRNQATSKDILSKFSKSLLEGSIDSSMSSSINSSFPFFLGLQYAWPKYFKIKLEKILSLFQADIYADYFKQIKSYIDQNSGMNNLPLFTVSNNLGQMIISESSNELGIKKDLLDHLLPCSKTESFHQAWFFINFNDAQEYMESINKYYGLKKGCLKIFACNFSTFYNIANKFSYKVSCRLMPDLVEISSLIKNYKYYTNISFHKRQQYGASYFQGQPLYVLKAKNCYTYRYLHNDQKICHYNLIFTSYKTAHKTLNKLTNNSSDFKKFKTPDLIVYNLESFIKDQVFSDKDNADLFLLVPSESSYQFAKRHLLKRKTGLIYEAVEKYLAFMQLWSKRILWSLTSKHPQDC